MDLEWNDLWLILNICRAGSLSGAARALGNNHSTVFRRLNAIEDRTKVRFFERMPDGYKMTDAGRTAKHYAERVEAEMQSLSREVLGQDLRLSGRIHVTAPEGFMAGIGPRLFANFMTLHPEITIDATGDLGAANLARREADVAIRATRRPPETAFGRSLCDFRFAYYASRAHRDRNAGVPLSEQRWVLVGGLASWLVPEVFKKVRHAEEQTVFTSSNVLAVMGAVAEGMGVTMMSCYTGDADERVVRVGVAPETRTLKLWLLTHPDLRHTARVKALIAFLGEELTKERALFEGGAYVEVKDGSRRP
jgi:DNA-binding transcriptional LysR family regulator